MFLAQFAISRAHGELMIRYHLVLVDQSLVLLMIVMGVKTSNLMASKKSTTTIREKIGYKKT